MKGKTRFATLLFAVLLLILYPSFFPDLSFQNYLSEQVLRLLDSKILGDASLQEKCTSYFQTLDQISRTNPSTSRFISFRKINNHIEHLRIYLRCFVENDIPNPRKAIHSRLLLPMFSERLPFTSNDHDWEAMDSLESSFWNKYTKLAEGRGIVVSLHESGSSYAERLLNVLKELRNELPIQFVHEKPISKGAKNRILEAAAVTSINQLAQSIEFIDTSVVLCPSYVSAFKGYNNKWFAALFTTFEHMILMDLDVVPFIKPSEMFELKGYLETGAYFFRDRELLETIPERQFDFLMNLVPKDEVFKFNVDQKMLDNNFFRFKSKHVMESGVVLMHRPTHISGLLISVSLQYWRKSGRIMYGDKDLFWLGQLVSGNLDFCFNENSAAALGVSDDQKTVCSSQLGHFSKDDNLLWINGGLFYCKRFSWLIDYLKCPFMRHKYGNSLKLMKSAYAKLISMEESVLPASIRVLNPGKGLGPSAKLRSHFNKNYNYGCGGIFYCASPDQGGRRLQFSAEEKSRFNKIIRAWSTDVIV